ncbi:hypothetical protein SAMN05444149_108104 [Pseudosulfitobacter pseudonitzschiae]|nr:hypothetical protein SAMN05444149_108104 [Pseudosulfitobacter pseudonitzschiae]
MPSEPRPAILLSGKSAARALKARDHLTGRDPPKPLRIKAVRYINAMQLKPVPRNTLAAYFPEVSPSASGNAAKMACVMMRS